jgi:hypothetical protein
MWKPVVATALIAAAVWGGARAEKPTLDGLEPELGRTWSTATTGDLVARDHECGVQFISCGQTVSSNLTLHDCDVGEGHYADLYVFFGQAGQTVTIDLSSPVFDPFLSLHRPADKEVVVSDDDGGPGLASRIVHQLTETSPEWGISAVNVEPSMVGSYTLSLACSGTSPPPPPPPPPPPTPSPTGCVRNDQTACLLGGRYEVRALLWNFANPPVLFPGRIQHYSGVSSETDQSVSFYAFQVNNVEIFVKMVDACDHPSEAFWLFTAGATTAETEVLVRDTVSGEVYRIFNPRGVLFEAVADTGAFHTCASGG